jgi:hypothetical protein
MIHAKDRPKDICRFLNDGWEPVNFLLALEEELKNGNLVFSRDLEDLPSPVGWRFFFWGNKGFETFGEWARVVASLVEPLLIKGHVDRS